MADLPLYLGPYRCQLPDGTVAFFDARKRVEWQGAPRSGVVFAPDYEESARWWWKSTPLSVQIRFFVLNHGMSVDEAAACCAVPAEAALAVLGLARDPQPIVVERGLELPSQPERVRSPIET